MTAEMTVESATTSTVLVDDPLEQIFQKLEQESEKRAQDEAELDDGEVEVGVPNEDDDTLRTPVATSTPGNPNSASPPPTAGVATEEPAATEAGPSTLRLRDKRRGSVSISVFGQQSETSLGNPNASNGTVSPPLMSPLATAASKSTFYHSLVNPQSVDTLSGEITEPANGPEHEDDDHVTRMQTIAGRRSSISRTVDKLLSNTSQRKRARSVLPPIENPNVEIGVSVEEKEAPVEIEGDAERAKAYADNTDTKKVLRTKRSSSWLQSIPSVLAPGALATRAKGFTQKFRRKSKPELAPSEGGNS